jgi:predicted permease
MRDFIYALRLLRRAPLFTAAAILTLGLGIGANTAIFSVVNAVLLKPIAVAEPDRLVSIFVVDRHNPGRTAMSTYNFRDLRDQNDVFSATTAIGFGNFTMTLPHEEPRQIVAHPVTANYFDVLGVKPIVGSGFHGDEDAQPGAHPIAVLSYGAWTRLFGADRAVLGRGVTINGRDFTIAGVMPPSFKGTATLFAPDLWLPLSMYDAIQPASPWLESRRWRWLAAVARLKPGVTVEAAQAGASIVARNLEREYPDINAGRTFEVIPLTESLINPDQRGGFIRAAWLLIAVVGLVLLTACANLANLLLARAAGRQKEMAIRLALGANRARVVRQMLAESVVLAILGGGVGLLLTEWLQSLLWNLRPTFLAQPGFELAIDARALTFTVLVSLGTGVIFGMAPALQASRTEIEQTLRLGGRQGASGVRRGLRGLFVVAEVSFSVVALAMAGLFLHSLVRAQQIDPGFRASQLLTVGVNPTAAGYDEARLRVWTRETVERISSLLGVRSATIADRLPLAGGIGYTVNIEGQPVPAGGLGYVVQNATVGPRYFETLGLAFVKGRDFAPTDREGSTQVAIVNETMARRFWPGADPIGKRFIPILTNLPIEIVGLVRDSRYVTLGEEPTPFFYIPLEQLPRQGLSLIVRSDGRPETIQTAVTAELHRNDPKLPVANVATMPDLVGQALWAPRTTALLLGVFASIALALAAVGIYGVMAYSVSQRTHELGLRMALGAGRREVLRLIVAQGMSLAGIGLALGLIFAVVAGRYISSLLYGVGAGDPVTLGGVAVVLSAVNLAACWLPAYRATRLDPVVVLRGE